MVNGDVFDLNGNGDNDLVEEKKRVVPHAGIKKKVPMVMDGFFVKEGMNNKFIVESLIKKIKKKAKTGAISFTLINDEKLLENSIIKNLSNKKTIAISLSGGIDSTLCLGLIRKIFPDKKIYGICGVFGEGFDESEIAGQVANQFNANFSVVKMDSIFTHMPEIISITKKPKWNTYIHLIAKKSRKFSKTFVTGDGADELFGGYNFRYNKFLNLNKKTDNWKIKTMNYLECHNRDWVPDQNKMFGDKIKFNWDEIYEYFRPYFQNKLEKQYDRTVLQTLLSECQRYSLPK